MIKVLIMNHNRGIEVIPDLCTCYSVCCYCHVIFQCILSVNHSILDSNNSVNSHCSRIIEAR